MVKTFAKKKDYKSHPSGDQSGTKSESYQSPIVQRVIERAEVAKELKTFEEDNTFNNPKLWDRDKKLAEESLVSIHMKHIIGHVNGINRKVELGII